MTKCLPLVYGKDDPLGAADTLLLGGKAANLLRLGELPVRVPSFYVITTEAFRAALSANGLSSRIQRRIRQAAERGDTESLMSAASEIRDWICGVELPETVSDAIARAHQKWLGDECRFAVRSSAAGEDAAAESFAGMHDSFLFVHGQGELFRAVRQVWASAYGDRAIAYRKHRSISLEHVAVAVVVQQMIDAERAGVMFTCNPATEDIHQLVVSSLFGAGEGLVSRGLAADTFVVDKDTLQAETERADKTEQLVFDPRHGGLTPHAVPESRRREPSLEPDQLQRICRHGLQIERHFGSPQDVEFCFDRAGELFILQSRPVVGVAELGPAAGNRIVWDNSNIVESYSGVTSPMTFSFIRRAYTIVYHCFAEVMGISPRIVRQNRDTFENMLGCFRGCVYYNLRNWYRLVRLFPGFQYNAPFMESMMGLKEPLLLEDEADSRPGFLRRWLVEFPALARLVLRSAWNFGRIRRIADEFQKNFHDHYDRWSRLDLRQMRPHELMQLYREMEDSLLWNWKAPIINDFFVMIFYGTLKRLSQSWCADTSGSLQNDLICGEGGVESAEPAKKLLNLAGMAQNDAQLRDLILHSSDLESLPHQVAENPRFAEFSRQLEKYLERFGFRCMNELKLEEFSLRDRPHLVYQVIRNYLSLNDPAMLDVEAMETHERQIRQAAEQRVDEALGSSWLGLRRWVFGWVLHSARLGVKNRENMRFARTRIYGLLREVLRAVGVQFENAGVLANREDVFYLTLDEVWDYVKGTAVTTRLNELAALRRAEYDSYRNELPAPDDRFETYGLAYHRNRFRGRSGHAQAAAGSQLQGIGCCPGIVTATAKVVRSSSDDLQLSGEILVAERTDPGWVPLYPAVSGLLIQRGSILSHSAVVAREMGIPTIVGINGLIANVQSGQTVRMDGSAGTVELLD